ncbi:MGMT family protein [Pedobacter sp. Leaf176]|uniref:methylated-DNA--[protein]-cysteine S-methyltransferase n=1 Tax=Pedobacter sp. Leaf176 TaxID=1736286 RepID=UPI0018D249D6
MAEFIKHFLRRNNLLCKIFGAYPLAIRAIASANGKNNIAIVVPCHRVIGSNGKLVGYAGGLWRKHWLLQHEREISQRGQTELKF